MKVTIEPTMEMYDATVNKQTVPLRIWSGWTDGGVEVELYVMAMTPVKAADAARLAKEIPPYMKNSRETYHIG